MKSITSKEMAYIDKQMINHYGISLIQMMENAGLSLAMLASKIIKYEKKKKITVLAGKGNNGGGGLVCARHLHNFGYDVKIILSNSSFKKVPLIQLKILKKMKVPILYCNDLKFNNNNSINKNNKYFKNENIIKKTINDSDLIIDALLGYNAKGNPYGSIKELIELSIKSNNKVLSLDLPSGVDPDTGKINKPCIKANYTLTLAYPKKGLVKAKKYTGKLFISYLTIPKDLSNKLKLKINHDFSQYLFAYL